MNSSGNDQLKQTLEENNILSGGSRYNRGIVSNKNVNYERTNIKEDSNEKKLTKIIKEQIQELKQEEREIQEAKTIQEAKLKQEEREIQEAKQIQEAKLKQEEREIQEAKQIQEAKLKQEQRAIQEAKQIQEAKLKQEQRAIQEAKQIQEAKLKQEERAKYEQRLINKEQIIQEQIIENTNNNKQKTKMHKIDEIIQKYLEIIKKRSKVKTICQSIAGILLLVIIILCIKYIPVIVKANSEAERIINQDDMNQNIFYSKAKKDGIESGNDTSFEDSEYVTEEDCSSDPDVWKYAVHAVIDVEDRNFYEHKGVDIKGLTAAVWTGIKNGGDFSTRGGSTITQQLVKLVVLNDLGKTEYRKAKEICLAMKLEEKEGFSKDKIIEYYLNNVNYRHKIGIARASDYYYGAKLTELNLSQIAYISAIPNRPVTYDPYNISEGETEAGFNAKTKKRMKLVLDSMLECESITEDEYNEALEFDVESTLKRHDK